MYGLQRNEGTESFEDNAIVRYIGKQTVEITEDCETQLKKHELLKT
jgi:hypothetical protein